MLYNFIGLDKMDEFVKIACVGSELIIDELNISVESKQDWDLELPFKTIRQIKRVLKRIPEQPLVLVFSDAGVEIKNICI